MNLPQPKPVITWILLLLTTITGIFLGYLRWTYLIAWEQGFKLIPRSRYNKIPYPTDWHTLHTSIISDPRWLSMILYSVLPFLLSLVVIHLLFYKKEYIRHTIIIYAVAWSMFILFSLLSMILPLHEATIDVAQNIKHLLQTPFFILLLVSGFKLNEILQKKSK